MKHCKNGQIIFKNRAEFNAEVNRHFKPLIAAEVSKKVQQAKDEAVKQVMNLMLPVLTTSIFETYGFEDDKQELCIRQFIKNMNECTEENIFEWDEYREFCEKKGKRYFDIMEVEE